MHKSQYSSLDVIAIISTVHVFKYECDCYLHFKYRMVVVSVLVWT